MTRADAVLAVLWIGLTLYVLLAGADFGGGFWDLLAGGTQRGMPQRRLIEHSIGPVWEANHVWLIFVVVLLWTCFSGVFAAVMSTAYIPLTLAAFGIIFRGSGFAFRKVAEEPERQRLFGAAFALASVLTPFFLGTVAGGIASGRIPPGIARGDLFRSWWNPTSVLSGLLAVGVGAYLAAVYLTGDAVRHAPDLVGAFRGRALGAGVVVGGVAVAGLLVVRSDDRALYRELLHGRGLPLIAVSIAAGVVSLGLLVARRYFLVRVSAGLAAAALLWGWGAGQYPNMLPGVTVDAAAAKPTVLTAVLSVVAAGAVVLLPSLGWLLALFQRERNRQAAAATGAGERV